MKTHHCGMYRDSVAKYNPEFQATHRQRIYRSWFWLCFWLHALKSRRVNQNRPRRQPHGLLDQLWNKLKILRATPMNIMIRIFSTCLSHQGKKHLNLHWLFLGGYILVFGFMITDSFWGQLTSFEYYELHLVQDAIRDEVIYKGSDFKVFAL